MRPGPGGQGAPRGRWTSDKGQGGARQSREERLGAGGHPESGRSQAPPLLAPTQPLVEFLHLTREPQLCEVPGVDQHVAVGHLDGVRPRVGVRHADKAGVAGRLGGVMRHRVHPGERGDCGIQGPWCWEPTAHVPSTQITCRSDHLWSRSHPPASEP